MGLGSGRTVLPSGLIDRFIGVRHPSVSIKASSAATEPIKTRIDEVLSCGRRVGEGRPIWRLQPIFIEQRERQAAEHGLGFQEASSFLAHDLR